MQASRGQQEEERRTLLERPQHFRDIPREPVDEQTEETSGQVSEQNAAPKESSLKLTRQETRTIRRAHRQDNQTSMRSTSTTFRSTRAPKSIRPKELHFNEPLNPTEVARHHLEDELIEEEEEEEDPEEMDEDEEVNKINEANERLELKAEHHSRHQHHPNCRSKQVAEPTGQLARVGRPTTLYSHQPHCIHHKPACHHKHLPTRPANRQDDQQAHLHQHHSHQLHQRVVGVDNLLPDPSKRVKYLSSKAASKGYLLEQHKQQQYHLNNNVDLRQTSLIGQPSTKPAVNGHESHLKQQTMRHLQQLASLQAAQADHSTTTSNHLKPNNEKMSSSTTTMRFVSQLYFLLHLSAIISLLLHHKNLVTSERKSPMASTINLPILFNLDANITANERHLLSPVASGLSGLANKEQEDDQVNASKRPRSIWSTSPLLFASPSFLGAHNSNQNQQDILVRLVGRRHAKSALQYFLCYLLSSSVTLLIGLWLWRVVCPQAAGVLAVHSGTGGLEADHQDCTPVLIGSISLGLIQLIVIGLDIANNVDWLLSSAGGSGGSGGAGGANPTGDFDWAAQQTRRPSGQHWPIYLPFLQFLFVSLLMQYILARVSKLS